MHEHLPIQLPLQPIMPWADVGDVAEAAARAVCPTSDFLSTAPMAALEPLLPRLRRYLANVAALPHVLDDSISSILQVGKSRVCGGHSELSLGA